jgi:hypothetical protein
MHGLNPMVKKNLECALDQFMTTLVYVVQQHEQ